MILITWCSFRERQIQKLVQRRCLTLNCRSRALPEVPVLGSLLPNGTSHSLYFLQQTESSTLVSLKGSDLILAVFRRVLAS